MAHTMKKAIFICTLLATSFLTMAQPSKGLELGVNYGFTSVDNNIVNYYGFMPSVSGGWWFNENMYAGVELGYASQIEGGMFSFVFRGAHSINNSPCTLSCDFTAGANFGSTTADNNPYTFQFLPGIQFPVSSKLSFRVSVGALSILDENFENGITSCILKGSLVF